MVILVSLDNSLSGDSQVEEISIGHDVSNQVDGTEGLHSLY